MHNSAHNPHLLFLLLLLWLVSQISNQPVIGSIMNPSIYSHPTAAVISGPKVGFYLLQVCFLFQYF